MAACDMMNTEPAVESLRVHVCMQDRYQWLTKCVLSRGEQLSGIEWVQSNSDTEDPEGTS